MYEKAFLTGCDEKTEWMLPWFFKNYRFYNKSPLVFADFGISDQRLVEGYVDAIIDLQEDTDGKGWFKKPEAMMLCPSWKTVWIDTDCEILESVDNIFDLLVPNKLNMVEDKPWTKRNGWNGPWYNSGVVGFIDKPQILRQWTQWVKESHGGIEAGRVGHGDQEVLYERLDSLGKLTYINELPNEYNWLRVQLESDNQNSWNKKIVHWTGQKGKIRIKEKMHG